MKLLQPNIRVLKIFSQANVGYLPLITAPPTQTIDTDERKLQNY